MAKIDKIKGGLVVSCQALENEPLHSSYIMSKMAKAVVEGGACGIRANSVRDIDEIKKVVDVPIIGIIKKIYGNNPVFITPTIREVEKLVEVGADIIAIDGTKRERPDAKSLKDLVKEIKDKYPEQKIMADISTVEEALYCEKIGFDFIGTTLVGYTEYTKDDEPLKILEKVISNANVKVIAEGNMNTPAHAKKAYELGAYSVVVGSMITRPQLITKKFVDEIKRISSESEKKYLAIDIGGTGVKYALIHDNGEIEYAKQFATKDYDDVSSFYEKLFSIVDLYKKDIVGIGISCTGKINEKTGTIVGGVNIMNGWLESPIKQIFKNKYKLPVYVNNDVKCIALSELWHGIGLLQKNFVCIAIGTGIGGAIVDNGNLICGENNFAGEFGHTILNFNGLDCKCGKKGCFEMYGSMSALIRDIEIATGEILKGEEIFAKLKNGDKMYVDLVDKWIFNISMGIVNIVLLLNPKVIVIGGAVSVQKELFIDKIEYIVKSFLTSEHSRDLEFVSAKNFNNAGMLGAVYGVKNLN